MQPSTYVTLCLGCAEAKANDFPIKSFDHGQSEFAKRKLFLSISLALVNVA